MRTITWPFQFPLVLESPEVLQQNKRTREKGEEWWCWQWEESVPGMMFGVGG